MQLHAYESQDYQNNHYMLLIAESLQHCVFTDIAPFHTLLNAWHEYKYIVLLYVM